MTFEEILKGLEKDEMFDVTFRLQQKFTQWGKKRPILEIRLLQNLKQTII